MGKGRLQYRSPNQSAFDGTPVVSKSSPEALELQLFAQVWIAREHDAAVACKGHFCASYICRRA
jgi:hypothetical protein